MEILRTWIALLDQICSEPLQGHLPRTEKMKRVQSKPILQWHNVQRNIDANILVPISFILLSKLLGAYG